MKGILHSKFMGFPLIPRLIASCLHTCGVLKMSLVKAGKTMLRDKGLRPMVTASGRN